MLVLDARAMRADFEIKVGYYYLPKEEKSKIFKVATPEKLGKQTESQFSLRINPCKM